MLVPVCRTINNYMKGVFTVFSFLVFYSLHAQDNYEIQVYGSQTQVKGSTMFELHSNYTFNGSKQS